MNTPQAVPGMQPYAYVKLLWNGRRTIFFAAIVCAVLSLIASLMVPRTYEARMTVLVAPPTFKEGIPEPPQAIGYSPRSLAILMPPPFAVETYQTLARSPNMLKEVSEALQLAPDSLSDLIGRCDVSLVALGSRTPQFGTTYADTLVFTVRANDPELAAKTVETWTSLFIARIDRLTGDLTDRTVRLVDTMYDDAKAKLQETEKQYESFQKQWNLTLLETEKTALEKLVGELEVEYQQNEIAAASTAERLAKTREQLASKDRIESLFQAPSADAYWITKQAAEAGQKAKPIEPEDGLRTEIHNPEYLEIKSAELLAEQELSEATAKRTELTTRIAAVREQVQKLQEDLATQKLVDTALLRELKTHGDTYELASKSKDKARFADASRESDLVIVSDAAAPGQPADVSRSLRVVIGFMLGAVLGTLYVLLRHALTAIANV